MALSVGNSNHYKVKEIRRRHFLETAKYCFLSEDRANEIIDELLETINNEVWNNINYSDLFDKSIKDKIIDGLKMMSKKLKS